MWNKRIVSAVLLFSILASQLAAPAYSVYAEEPVIAVDETPTPTPEPTITIEPTAIPTEVIEPTPTEIPVTVTLTVTPSPTEVITPTPTAEVMPTVAIEPTATPTEIPVTVTLTVTPSPTEVVTPTHEPTVVVEPTATPTPEDKRIKIGETYSYGSTKIKFNSAANPGQVEFAQLDINGQAAYEFISDMTNGSFNYDLTLPYPADFNTSKMQVLYSEDGTNFNEVNNTVSIDEINHLVTIYSLDHFTVFLLKNAASLTVNNVTLTNTTTGNAAYIKDNDILVLTATIEGPSSADITADLSGVGGATNTDPDSYNSTSGVATWTIAASGSNNGLVTLTVNADTASASVSTNADNTIPTLVSQTAFSGWYNNPVSNFTYTEGLSNSCVIATEGLAQTCTPAAAACDLAGNCATIPTSNAADVDHTNPVVYAGTDKLTNVAIAQDATASDALSGIASYLWTNGDTTEDTTLSAVSDGAYTIQLAVTDQAGNVGTDTMILTWDTTPPSAPVVTITNPINIANQTAVTVTVTGEANTDANYTISDGVNNITGLTTNPTGSFTINNIDLSSFNDGPVTLTVTLTDSLGNTGLAGTANTTKDTIAPTASVVTPVTTPTNDNTPNLTVNVENGVGFTIGSTSGIGTGLDQVVTLNTLTDGTYNLLSLVATDAAGNSTTVAVPAFVIDTLAPATSGVVLTNPINIANVSTSTLTISGELNTTYNYSVGSLTGSGILSTSPLNIALDLSSLADGTVVAAVTLTDASGNISALGSTSSTKDTVAPTASIVTPVVANTNDNTPDIVINVESGANFTINTNSGVGTGANQTVTLNTLTDGSYSFNLVATDAAGNITTVAIPAFTVDTVAPTLVSQTTFSGWYNTAQTSIFTYTDGQSASCVINTEGVSQTCTVTPNACDLAGNCNTTPVISNPANQDFTNPLVNAGANQISNVAFNQTGTASDVLSGLASTTWSQVSGPGSITFGTANALTTTVSASVDGNYVIRLTAVDNAGNSSIDDFNLVWDVTAPTGTILINGGAANTTNANITLTLAATDNLTGVAFMAFSNDNVTYSANQTYATTAAWTLVAGNGTRTVYVRYTDVAGNTSVFSDTIILDTLAPVVTWVNPIANANLTGTSVTLNATATDIGGSGIASLTYAVSAGTLTGTVWNIANLPMDVYTLSATAVDNVGRTTTVTISVNVIALVTSRTNYTIDQTRIYVAWTTDRPASGEVRFGTTSNVYTGTTGLTTSQAVTISGLSDNTSYFWRIYTANASGSLRFADSLEGQNRTMSYPGPAFAPSSPSAPAGVPVLVAQPIYSVYEPEVVYYDLPEVAGEATESAEIATPSATLIVTATPSPKPAQRVRQINWVWIMIFVAVAVIALSIWLAKEQEKKNVV